MAGGRFGGFYSKLTLNHRLSVDWGRLRRRQIVPDAPPLSGRPFGGRTRFSPQIDAPPLSGRPFGFRTTFVLQTDAPPPLPGRPCGFRGPFISYRSMSKLSLFKPFISQRSMSKLSSNPSSPRDRCPNSLQTLHLLKIDVATLCKPFIS